MAKKEKKKIGLNDIDYLGRIIVPVKKIFQRYKRQEIHQTNIEHKQQIKIVNNNLKHVDKHNANYLLTVQPMRQSQPMMASTTQYHHSNKNRGNGRKNTRNK